MSLFVDTNVAVYVYDRSALAKRARARETFMREAVLTEDLNAGQIIRGVEVVNPFEDVG